MESYTESVRILRVVVASPSDVQAEREAVDFVVHDLNQSLCVDRGFRLELARWETDTYPGFHPDGPQGLIDPILKIEDCDILIGIFWKRFGTPTSTSESGTEYEFRVAYEAWKANRRPQVMMYFNQKPHTPQSKDETDQWGRVLEFRRAFPVDGLWWPYRGSSKFANLLRSHLTNFIRATFPLGFTAKLVDSQKPTTQTGDSAYFAIQSRLIQEYTSTFVGRTEAKDLIGKFLNTQRRGYLIVRGAPGQGKTALTCDLVKDGKYIHHFISRSGGRADSRLILCSLVWQLRQPTQSEDNLTKSVPDLMKMFEELLAEASSRREKTVIVIDGLDELPENLPEEPFLITDMLLDGVFFIVTSRPGDRLERLQARLFSVPKQILELGPLDTDEMRAILRTIEPEMSPTDIERVARVSQGNPLYLRAATAHLQANRTHNLQFLPPSIEDFFRRATSSLSGGNAVLRDVLSLLSTARIPLSVTQLSEILDISQRDISAKGVTPIRPFLFDADGTYVFYHSRFHEFVLQSILYKDELRVAHQKIARWLQLGAAAQREYRFRALAHHLFESGDFTTLINVIDEPYLVEKLHRLGYAVLEDIELWTRALLTLEDPSLVSRCVSLVESLRQAAGGDILPDALNAIRSHRDEPAYFRASLLEPKVPSIPGLDVYVGVLPNTQVSADFIELVPKEGRLVLAIGDAPSVGLKSAFAARFLGNTFHATIEREGSLELNRRLGTINSMIRGNEYFERITMQCADIDPKSGLLRISNAGHVFPVHYSLRRQTCDILPLRGDLLNDPFSRSSALDDYEEYALKIESGDVLVFVTDGVTEDHVIRGEAYGYRFTRIVEAQHDEGAQAIGKAILDDWKAHPRGEAAGDDFTLAVISLNGRREQVEQ